MNPRVRACGRLGIGLGVFLCVAAALAAPDLLVVEPPASKDPQVEALLTKALELRRTGQTTDARAELQQALKLDPNCLPAHWQLGEVLQDKLWKAVHNLSGPDPAVLAEYDRLLAIADVQPEQLYFKQVKLQDTVTYLSGKNEISGPDTKSTGLRYIKPELYFARRRFELQQKPTSGILRVFSVGDVQIFVNGQPVGHVRIRNHEARVGITSHLSKGENVIAVQAFEHEKNTGSGMRLKLEMIMPDHTLQAVTSDDQWRVAQRVDTGWARRSYADANWTRMRPADENDKIVVADPKLRKLENGEIDHQHPLDLQDQQDLAPSIEVERALAQWCEDHGLTARASKHWMNALQMNSSDSRALNALELVRYGKRFVPKADIEQVKADDEAEKSERTAMAQRLHQLSLDFQSQDSQKVDSARKTIGTLDESALEPFLKLTKLNKSAAPRYEKFAVEFVKRQFPQWRSPRATNALVSIACEQQSADLRAAATRILQDRPYETFVPQALSRLSAPVVARVEVVSHNGNELIVRGLMHQENQSEAYEFVNEQRFVITHENPRFTIRRSLLKTMPAEFFVDLQQESIRGELARRRTEANALQAAENAKKNLERIAAERTSAIGLMNQRVADLMNAVTHQNLGAAINDWLNWWRDYNSIDPTPPTKPVYQTATSRTTHLRYRAGAHIRCCCFAAGTPVWTESGPRPIETVKVGDWVLAQNPVTGELAMKPVAALASRRNTETKRLKLEGDEITATAGHRFWKYDAGWVMVKHLQANDRLHTSEGSTVLQSVTDGPEASVYNLIVEDFHSYFVGKSGLYVHDNELPEILGSSVPGLDGVAVR